MCSVEEDGGQSEMLKKESRGESAAGKTCMKCKENSASLLIRRGDPFCRSCFQEYCYHKYRAALGKTRVVRDADRVLLAYSGGPASAALVHLTQLGSSSEAKKRLRFRPAIAFVDEGAAFNQRSGERLELCEKVSAEMLKTGWPAHIVALEEAVELDKATKYMLPAEGEVRGIIKHFSVGRVAGTEHISLRSVVESSAKEKRLRSMLSAITDDTSRTELVRTLRLQLLCSVAKRCGYDKVMMADSSSRLSVQLLSNIAQGRGSSAAFNMSFYDDRWPVPIVRPMREFTAKEISMYNFYNKVHSHSHLTSDTKAAMNANVERLTQNFVYGLQEEFPSTVSTVFRTGDKLEPPEVSKEDGCVLCGGSLDSQTPAVNALRLSEQLTKHKAAAATEQEEDDCCSSDACCSDDVKHSLKLEQVSKFMCHGCTRIASAVGDASLLPDYVKTEVTWRLRRQKMEHAIKDALYLDD